MYIRGWGDVPSKSFYFQFLCDSDNCQVLLASAAKFPPHLDVFFAVHAVYGSYVGC